jgi:uncharacterized protein YjiS (DUF1127 family)
VVASKEYTDSCQIQQPQITEVYGNTGDPTKIPRLSGAITTVNTTFPHTAPTHDRAVTDIARTAFRSKPKKPRALAVLGLVTQAGGFVMTTNTLTFHRAGGVRFAVSGMAGRFSAALARVTDGIATTSRDVVRRRLQRKAIAHLRQLDDHLLKDIGMHRSEITSMVYGVGGDTTRRQRSSAGARGASDGRN